MPSCDRNKTKQIPKPYPYPSPCVRNTLSAYPVEIDPSQLAPNQPNPNPGSPNPLPTQEQYGYHGFPQLPSEGKASVAILGAPDGDDSWNNDVKSKIINVGAFANIDVFNVGAFTPTLSRIQGYKAVLVYSDDNFADSNGLGDVLANYVNGG